ncbi:anion exchange protein 4 [Trichosurus vulpecula]|uniref:anion exchange protein 4 n=1 Tax=Trichosurus vulpecula TaxID=9337 RepID=UPI00186B3B7C|nr:anion exchange protein 4 [Trichosurus vulpecula]
MRPPEQELEYLGDPETSPLRDSGSSHRPTPLGSSEEEGRKQRGVGGPYFFIQLNELLGSPQNQEWRETGRWMLFEEKLDLEARRWSSPHVPILSLSSIWELRALLTTGLVLLDCPVQSLSELTEQVTRVESLNPEVRERLKSVLLQRPQHHMQPMCWSAARRLGTRLCRGGHPTETPSSAEEPPLKEQLHSPLWQKLPPGTEAAAVLVGELDFLTQRLGVFVHFPEPVVLGTLTEVPLPTRFVCIILGPPALGKDYREMGRSVAVLLSDQLFRRSASQASGPQDLISAMDTFLEEVMVLPPGGGDLTERIPPPKCLSILHKRLPLQLREPKDSCNGNTNPKRDRHGYEHEPQPVSKELQRTGRLFGALVQDIRRKAPWYLSDFSDALNVQCFPAVLYIYLATITNAITFGGLLGDATDNFQGVLESFLGTAVAGSIFCLFAGQPLTILSSTGPVLVFERILFAFSRDHGLDYLPFRLWVGIWVAFFCLVLVALEASVLVRHFTRFTEEGFCALISLIFIYDAIGKMLSLMEAYPIYRPGISGDTGVVPYGCLCYFPDTKGNASLWKGQSPEDKDAALRMKDLGLGNVSLLSPPECALQGGQPRGLGCHFVPDIAFFSLLLFFATFLCATILKHFKSSHFFPSRVRKVISDFSMVLAILLGCGLDASFGLSTPKLIVPSEFKLTHPGRRWLVPLFGANPWWLCLATALPALLMSILVFMDQQITAVILNRKEYQLQKGAGFHLDLFWVAMLMLLTSALGLPWYVSTTVISLAHMDSLRRESATCVPGELPHFLGIREQRLTGLVVFILTGVSIFLAPGLKFIPMPVLYGIFFYMGMAALSSTQFLERVKLLLMPAKQQPDLLLLRHVPLSRIHLFTTVQLVCLGLLWAVKSTAAAIVFPLMLLGLVGIRKALERIFSPQELSWLDDPVQEENEKKVQEEKSELIYQLRAPEINISVN